MGPVCSWRLNYDNGWDHTTECPILYMDRFSDTCPAITGTCCCTNHKQNKKLPNTPLSTAHCKSQT